MTLFSVLTCFFLKKQKNLYLGFMEKSGSGFSFLFSFVDGGVEQNRTISIPWHFSLDFIQAFFILILMNK